MVVGSDVACGRPEAAGPSQTLLKCWLLAGILLGFARVGPAWLAMTSPILWGLCAQQSTWDIIAAQDMVELDAVGGHNSPFLSFLAVTTTTVTGPRLSVFSKYRP